MPQQTTPRGAVILEIIGRVAKWLNALVCKISLSEFTSSNLVSPTNNAVFDYRLGHDSFKVERWVQLPHMAPYT